MHEKRAPLLTNPTLSLSLPLSQGKVDLTELWRPFTRLNGTTPEGGPVTKLAKMKGGAGGVPSGDGRLRGFSGRHLQGDPGPKVLGSRPRVLSSRVKEGKDDDYAKQREEWAEGSTRRRLCSKITGSRSNSLSPTPHRGRILQLEGLSLSFQPRTHSAPVLFIES